MRSVVYSLSTTLALACAGCGNRSNLYPVSGKVMYQGAPASGAAVFLYRQGGDPMNEHLIMGVVRDDGAFDLVCGSLGQGAPPGEYDVLIEWRPFAGQSKGRPQRGPDRLNGRFADRQNPRFHVTVKNARNELPPFDVSG